MVLEAKRLFAKVERDGQAKGWGNIDNKLDQRAVTFHQMWPVSAHPCDGLFDGDDLAAGARIRAQRRLIEAADCLVKNDSPAMK
ncbi:hypothetical protein [Mesorhizobium sp. M0968]|uniref:hypothetical protein n=1 Tax=Mesorhizobium sp. M0968 TaxID=2957037 RepID=UPI0033362F67